MPAKLEARADPAIANGNDAEEGEKGNGRGEMSAKKRWEFLVACKHNQVMPVIPVTRFLSPPTSVC